MYEVSNLSKNLSEVLIVAICCSLRIKIANKDSITSCCCFRSTELWKIHSCLSYLNKAYPVHSLTASYVLILILLIIVWNGFVIVIPFLPQCTRLGTWILFVIPNILSSLPLTRHVNMRGMHMRIWIKTNSWEKEWRDASDPAQNTTLPGSAPSSEFVLIHLRFKTRKPRKMCLLTQSSPISHS